MINGILIYNEADFCCLIPLSCFESACNKMNFLKAYLLLWPVIEPTPSHQEPGAPTPSNITAFWDSGISTLNPAMGNSTKLSRWEWKWAAVEIVCLWKQWWSSLGLMWNMITPPTSWVSRKHHLVWLSDLMLDYYFNLRRCRMEKMIAILPSHFIDWKLQHFSMQFQVVCVLKSVHADYVAGT